MAKEKMKNKSIVFVLLFVVLAIYAASMLFLLAWGIITSLKTQNDFRTNVLWFPEGYPWQWEYKNYSYMFENFLVPVKREIDGVVTPLNIDIGTQILYTFLYAGVGAILSAIVPCAVAYVTSKFKCVVSNVVYTVVIVTMVIPIIGAQTSEMQILRSLNLYDTFLGAWILKFNFMGMYYLVFFGAFKMISKEYTEAAYLDGAGEWTVFLRIILPFVKTTLYTVILLKFIDFWNDYQMPLLYMPSHPTLAYGVWFTSITSLTGFSTVPMRMTACCLVAFPILILFIILKDKMMGNISMGGVKE